MTSLSLFARGPLPLWPVAWRSSETPIERIAMALDGLTAWMAELPDSRLGDVGAVAVRHDEATLRTPAEALDAARFVGAVKHFEHQVNAVLVLDEANRAHHQRWSSISATVDGLARIERQLAAEAAATIRSAMEPVHEAVERRRSDGWSASA